MANQVVWFDVPVANLDRAIQFYSAVLGRPVKKESMPGMTIGVLPHEGEDVGGCLVVMDKIKPSDQGILVYFNVEGRIDAAIEAVPANGGKVIEAKHAIGPYGFRAIALDSEGNRIALHSR